jgi:negative regulator of sigma E activity
MNEELDSQLSAMFDDELPSAECELLARRLSRDEQLKARWGRYAVMGAVIRAERGVRLNAPLAGRVSAVLLAEPALGAQSLAGALPRRGLRWWQPVAAGALAAGVAAVSILWLRAEAPSSVAALNARLTTPAASTAPMIAASARERGGRADSYVVPPTPAVPAVVVPSTELANYVVAHSMFSSPVARRNLLSAFMTSEPAAAGAEESPDDAKSAAQ